MKYLPGSVQGLVRAGAPRKQRGPEKRHAVGTLSPKGLRPQGLVVLVRIRPGACPERKPVMRYLLQTGEGQWGSVPSHKGRTGAVKWQLPVEIAIGVLWNQTGGG